MPLYSNIGAVTSIAPGDQVAVFNADAAISGQASQQLALQKPYMAGLVYIGVELLFSATPGTFELDIQEADTDTDAAYVTIGSISAVSAGQYARGDYQVTGRFCRAFLKTLTNVVNTTVRITQR